jgi:hypothetical protein
MGASIDLCVCADCRLLSQEVGYGDDVDVGPLNSFCHCQHHDQPMMKIISWAAIIKCFSFVCFYYYFAVGRGGRYEWQLGSRWRHIERRRRLGRRRWTRWTAQATGTYCINTTKKVVVSWFRAVEEPSLFYWNGEKSRSSPGPNFVCVVSWKQVIKRSSHFTSSNDTLGHLLLLLLLGATGSSRLLRSHVRNRFFQLSRGSFSSSCSPPFFNVKLCICLFKQEMGPFLFRRRRRPQAMTTTYRRDPLFPPSHRLPICQPSSCWFLLAFFLSFFLYPTVGGTLASSSSFRLYNSLLVGWLVGVFVRSFVRSFIYFILPSLLLGFFLFSR